MSKNYLDEDDIENGRADERDDSEQGSTKVKGRSDDYDKKRKRAEKILEQARIRELLGFDIDL